MNNSFTKQMSKTLLIGFSVSLVIFAVYSFMFFASGKSLGQSAELVTWLPDDVFVDYKNYGFDFRIEKFSGGELPEHHISNILEKLHFMFSYESFNYGYLLTFILAITAISIMNNLNSREYGDFYNSLPVSRFNIYAVNYLGIYVIIILMFLINFISFKIAFLPAEDFFRNILNIKIPFSVVLNSLLLDYLRCTFLISVFLLMLSLFKNILAVFAGSSAFLVFPIAVYNSLIACGFESLTDKNVFSDSISSYKSLFLGGSLRGVKGHFSYELIPTTMIMILLVTIILIILGRIFFYKADFRNGNFLNYLPKRVNLLFPIIPFYAVYIAEKLSFLTKYYFAPSAYTFLFFAFFAAVLFIKIKFFAKRRYRHE